MFFFCSFREKKKNLYLNFHWEIVTPVNVYEIFQDELILGRKKKKQQSVKFFSYWSPYIDLKSHRKTNKVPSLVSHWRGNHWRTWLRWNSSWWRRWRSCTRHSDTVSWVQAAESRRPCSQWKLQNTTWFEKKTKKYINNPLSCSKSTQPLLWIRSFVLDQRLGQLVPFRFVRATVGSVNAGILGIDLFLRKSGVKQLHQFVAAVLLQQLDLKGCFTQLKVRK